MSALDLTAAVEAGARAAWEDWRERRPASGLAAWEDTEAIHRHSLREAHLPVVAAVVAAIAAEVREALAIEPDPSYYGAAMISQADIDYALDRAFGVTS